MEICTSLQTNEVERTTKIVLLLAIALLATILLRELPLHQGQQHLREVTIATHLQGLHRATHLPTVEDHIHRVPLPEAHLLQGHLEAVVDQEAEDKI